MLWAQRAFVDLNYNKKNHKNAYNYKTSVREKKNSCLKILCCYCVWLLYWLLYINKGFVNNACENAKKIQYAAAQTENGRKNNPKQPFYLRNNVTSVSVVLFDKLNKTTASFCHKPYS